MEYSSLQGSSPATGIGDGSSRHESQTITGGLLDADRGEVTTDFLITQAFCVEIPAPAMKLLQNSMKSAFFV
ncbi:MAG: hypothetical protein C0600_04465 [Ignavibacteria bacterium]|nr:MAG: hypothetical protein C0600_04465 [Ignavibacteria bacterium]